MKKIKTILAILPALLFSCAGDDVEKYIPPTPVSYTHLRAHET